MDEFDLVEADVHLVNDIYKVDPRTNDRRICICGHAVSRHHFNKYEGRQFCKPGQLSCPCIEPRPVLDVPNTRYFMRKSQGSGEKHALARGVAASIEALGEEFTEKRVWLAEQKCDVCKQETKYYPARVNAAGENLVDYDEDQGINAFLCEDCRKVYAPATPTIK